MSEPVKPAMSAEEWAQTCTDGECRPDNIWARVVGWHPDIDERTMEEEPDYPAIAALCLDGQPFGFRWADVDDCRARARDFEALHEFSHDLTDYEAAQRWHNRADRIEALLRPRKDGTE